MMRESTMMGGVAGNSDFGNETMYVSKDRNLRADIYMESDAEEIYVPDGANA